MNGYVSGKVNRSIDDLLCFICQEQVANAEDLLKDFNVCCTQEMTIREPDVSVLRGGPGYYKVVKTGPSGHNIRSCPNLRGIPIGMLVLGNKVKAVGEVWTLLALLMT